ncbi:MAG: hypothetical protein ACRDOU_03375 [Streptosporangiaceae bacterium]
MTRTEDTELRRRVDDLLGALQPPAVRLDQIIRRGNGIRLRRAGAAAVGVGLAAIIAVTTLGLHGSPSPTTAPSGPVTRGGVIASGTADGHAWKLAVQDIADPGYRCLPAITINSTDADPVYPDPENVSVVTLGPAFRGVGFGFIQLPASSSGITVNGLRHVPAVTAAACGYRYHIAGFAYSLEQAVHVSVDHPPPGWPTDFPISQPLPAGVTPQSDGLWINTYAVHGETASGLLASGYLSGQEWSLLVMLGPGGDCYAFNGNGYQMGTCGPVGTPDGAETIMALPLGFPEADTGATGYAFPVSPGTAHLKAVLSNGSSELVTPRVVDGRKYVGFIVPDPFQLARLTWLDAAGRVIASTTALPQYGYVQFQP